MKSLAIALLIISSAVSNSFAAPKNEQEPGRAYKIAGWLLVGTATGDVLSTELCLHTATCREGNPFMTNRAVRIGYKVGFTTLAFYGTEQLRRNGHPREAAVFRWVAIALYGYWTAHNLRLAYQ